MLTSFPGDPNKPIYRYMADKKWREMKRKVLVQRLTQMHVVPDLLPAIDPVLDIDLLWHGRITAPGEYVTSSWSQSAPSLRLQKFDKGEKIVTVVAVDADVPNLETDSFAERCHGIWTDITISPTTVNTGFLGSKSHTTILPWTPPYAQKGSPYHRIALFVLEQASGKSLSEETLARFKTGEAKFTMKEFARKLQLSPVTATMFRCQWDEDTAAVMKKHGIPGADMEFKRKPSESLPEKYTRKDGLRYRGWKK